jgi:hypothetical protein
MSIGSGEWYVRTRGRVLGPFNRSQLATMRDRGQLTPDLEVSQDRRSWIKAAELPGIFAKADEAQAPQKAASNTEWPALRDEPGTGSVARTADVLPSWFVARGESHQGPLGIADLQRMFAAGETELSGVEGRNAELAAGFSGPRSAVRGDPRRSCGLGRRLIALFDSFTRLPSLPSISDAAYQRTGDRQPRIGATPAVRNQQPPGDDLRRRRLEPDLPIERLNHRQGPRPRGAHPGNPRPGRRHLARGCLLARIGTRWTRTEVLISSIVNRTPSTSKSFAVFPGSVDDSWRYSPAHQRLEHPGLLLLCDTAHRDDPAHRTLKKPIDDR